MDEVPPNATHYHLRLWYPNRTHGDSVWRNLTQLIATRECGCGLIYSGVPQQLSYLSL